ncbi:hypothetical protein EHQ58_07490 [Leptospira ognonensis]|uniref:Uncharacterized protein n=1 Tax=Leptospira ognonensis TaxID=2484945 RepID=A0A4R9K2U6_9LEPT|nr:hypothetical protein [Leptospira ognonensis]TGL60329.1 hypothetical protein EHQ58_07490 [Leptospira ognonensis]
MENAIGKNKIIKDMNMRSFFTLLAVIFSACISKSTYSQDLLPESLYYYEGNQKVLLEIDPSLVAEFGGTTSAGGRNLNSPLVKADANAKLIRSHGQINIWKTNGQGGAVGISKSLNQSQNQGYSPIFRSLKGSANLALPGNIIVELERGITEKQAEVFFGSKGLRIFKKHELDGRNFYEVETPAGAASLNIANSLYGQSGVISSSPNWWREVTAK